jgi:inositol phosphorylceramide mannosyltransferase catalytic subunit
MIPKKIHQTAKTEAIPYDVQKYVDTVRSLHPDWEYKLWTDEDNLAFVTKEYPEFLEVYQGLPKNIMRADVIRYLLLYRVGGLYLDTDYEMLRAFDLCDKEIVLCWEPHPNDQNRPHKIANAVFASSPGHPFFRMLIDDLQKNPPRDVTLDVEMTTGPGFVTRIYEDAKSKGMTLFTTPPIEFNPFTPRNIREYRAIREGKTSYGIHHCNGSWRTWTFSGRLKNFLKKVLYRFGY